MTDPEAMLWNIKARKLMPGVPEEARNLLFLNPGKRRFLTSFGTTRIGFSSANC
jgi:hypothetical protein